MMKFSFDLISDLHVETWDQFDWTGQATSPYCILAGDVCEDLAQLKVSLTHLSKCYQAVFYIDGNEEHSANLDDLQQSYHNLYQHVQGIKNVVYLRDNVVIINGVAILATNGWWTYNFNPWIDEDQSKMWHQNRKMLTANTVTDIKRCSHHDAAYMVNSVRKLQKHRDVKTLVMVTHTVPAPWLIEHDPELESNYRFNLMGNQHMQAVFDSDTEGKIKTWCFGHYHTPIDTVRDGVRFVNNCRGRGDTQYRQMAYNPVRITVEY